MDLDAGYLDALTAARSALGLDDVLPELAASREDRLVRDGGVSCGDPY